MIFYGVTNSGEKVKLNNLLKVNLNIEEYVPADDLTVMFAKAISTEFIQMLIYVDDKLFFKGIVDEQTTVFIEKYTYTKFVVRNMASTLLDNEALPKVYICPNDITIFRKHIEPFGIDEYINNNSLNRGNIKISKGQSQWDVVNNFCNVCLNSSPEVSTDGKLLMNGYIPTKTIKFGLNTQFPIDYAHICKKPHKLISQVFLKIDYKDSYKYNLKNDFALNKGVLRHRYINATDTTFYSVNTAQKVIEKSNNDYINITIKTPKFMADVIGQNAEFVIGETVYKNMYIYKVAYSYNQGKENTTIALRNRSKGVKLNVVT